MVDLQGQLKKIEPQIRSKFDEIFDNTQFIKGDIVKEFEKDLAAYLDVKHVISCGNGTDALQIALMSLNLQPGDEVITVDFTFAATVEVVGLLGLTPVLIDVDPNTFNMDVNELEKAITPKTKAIIPVHLFGQCADMEKILGIAKKHQIPVIEDNAQAIGATYTFSDGKKQKAGTMGRIGTTSFFPSKNLGAFGDGGALFTNDDELAEKIRSITNHGMSVRYHYDRLGVNSRLDSLQAAVLSVKLPLLDEYIAARQQAALWYNEAFKDCQNIQTPFVAGYTDHVFHQYTIVLKGIDRDALHQHLLSKNIPNAIYYPVPLHSQKAYENFHFIPENLTTSITLSKSVLSLPMHTELTKEQVEFISAEVLDFIKSHS